MSSPGPSVSSEKQTERTFQYDDSLPPLPVPALEKTLDRYLDSVRPFLTAAEYDETVKIVGKFGTGIGKSLHQKLLQKAAKDRNWLESWWEELVYLSGRTALAVRCNMTGPFCSLQDIWPARENTQLERSANYLWMTLHYFQRIRREELPVAKNRAGTKKFDMNQLKSFFCASRVPGEPIDTLVRCFKTESEGSCPDHVVVLSNGHVFKLTNLFDDQGELIGALELYRHLRYIKEQSATSKGQGICILTADDRTSWANIYQYMCSADKMNQRNFQDIQSAIITLSLDNQSPQNETQVCQQLMFGPQADDRWFDKSYNCVAFSNGTFGSTLDHCPMDGIVLAEFAHWVHNILKDEVPKWMGNPSTGDSHNVPKELIFVTDGEVDRAIEHAWQTYRKDAEVIDTLYSNFTNFGKVWCKKEGFHPDAFLQLALQLAYYSKYGRPAPCYETATTRQFYHGRTETVRSCSMENFQWCQAMLDPSKSKLEKLKLMKKAHMKHLLLLSEAADGKGCDRHLLGLYIIAMQEGIETPELYTHPSYSKSGGGGNFVLSTSLIGYAPVLGSVAAMCPDGYGIFYAIQEHSYYITITCYKTSPVTDAGEFFQQIYRSMVEMQKLVLPDAKF